MRNLSEAHGIAIGQCPALTALHGLEDVVSVEELWLQRLPIRDLHGLDGLRTISDSLGIQANEKLETLAGLESVSGAFSITIGDNPLLYDISALKQVTEAAQLAVAGNDALTSLSGLDGLTSVRGLSIEQNASLRTLSGLDGIASVQEEFLVADNPLLASLHGLDGVRRVDGSFGIRSNQSLPTCEAVRLRDRIGAANIGGDIEIAGNDDGGVCPP